MRNLRIMLLFVAAASVIVLYALSRPLVDFVVYWTAAHLFVAHKNPYSIADVYQIQHALGFNGPLPLMLLCPPWALAAFAPLGYAQSYLLAWCLWMLILISTVAISSRVLMDLYFGSLQVPEVSSPHSYRYLFAFTFYPVLLGLKFAQIAPLILLGVAGFVYFEAKNRPALAGILLSLTLLKPHLLFLVWIAVLLRSLRARQWKVPVSSTAVIIALSTVTLAHNPQVFQQYWGLMIGPFPQTVLSGILAGVRDALQPRPSYWLQYLPPIVGLVWFARYWRKHKNNWCWIDRLPMLVTASLITAPYGFTFDQTLLIIPITFLAAESSRESGRIPTNAVLLYTALNATVLLVAIYSTPWAVVPAPLLIAGLLYRRSRFGNSRIVMGAIRASQHTI